MSLGEFEVIERYFAAHSARGDVLLGIGDDGAVLECPDGKRLVIAMDTIVEGVHFLADADPFDIGYRALAVNLSDIAAMGAVPSWMTLSLSLQSSDEHWLKRFSEGLFALAREHEVALVGGDTVKGPLVITVQIAGWVEPDRWLTRAGAKPGDLLFVSGVPGEAAAGLSVIQRHIKSEGEFRTAADHLRERFLRPTPRVALGRELRTLASAAMDVSDGLLTDLDKLCSASGCGARVDIDRLPLSDSMKQLFDRQQCVDYALAGGDDYELLFTVPPQHAQAIDQLSVACTRIGVITSGDHAECFADGQPINVVKRGYDHFQSGAGSI
jgi:thiamine-monophosphate kinase